MHGITRKGAISVRGCEVFLLSSHIQNERVCKNLAKVKKKALIWTVSILAGVVLCGGKIRSSKK